MQSTHTRRRFLKNSTTLAASLLAAPSFLSSDPARAAEENRGPNERLLLGAIGVGGRGTGIAGGATRHGTMVGISDVDLQHAERGKKRLSGDKAEIYRDYRKLLEQKDIDVITIGTPDHWHSKIAVEALLAGKDIYCEKPLTLTIEEGQLISKAVKKTGRVFQVGTQQRSEMGLRFPRAVALCRAGRIGKIKKITCAIGGGPRGGPFEEQEPPAHLDWNFWLGQTPEVPYVRQRCHGSFRWWYAYSGGKMTDWGAHHVDIAHWAIGADDTSPIAFEGTAEHPNIPNGFNTAVKFNVHCTFANGIDLVIVNRDPKFGNGILFEGEKGSIYVDRGRIDTSKVPGFEDDPLPEDAIGKLYSGKQPGSHMRNFFDCVRDRTQPVSDVFSHHRALTTCHLANICNRIGRPLKWDPERELIIGDGEARSMQRREPRRGYEITL